MAIAVGRREAALGIVVAGLGAVWPSTLIAADVDDTHALNQALQRGGMLQLAPGRTYRIREPLRIRGGCQLSGDITSTIQPIGNFPAIIVEGSSVVLRGFSVTGSRDQFRSSGSHGILIDWRKARGEDVTIRSVTVSSVAGSGIIALGSSGTRSSGLTVSGCTIKAVGAHGIIAQDYIDNVHFEDNVVRGTSLSYPDRPGITGSRRGSGIIIRNNRCYGSVNALGTSVHGISLDGCSDVLCDGNLIQGWSHGYSLEIGGVSAGTVSHNHISDGRYGIGMSGVNGKFRNEDITISDNTVENMTAAGIYSFIADADGRYLHRRITLQSNSVRQVTDKRIGIGAFLTNVSGLSIDGLYISECEKSGLALIDCTDYDIRDLIVSGSNRTADPAHAGVALRWLKIPAHRRGRTYIDPAHVKGNGGLKQIAEFRT